MLNIPIHLVFENPASLTSAQEDTPEFQALLKSVKRRGIVVPLVLRKLFDHDRKEEIYAVIDGQRRLRAANIAGLREVPGVMIVMQDDLTVLEFECTKAYTQYKLKPVELVRGLQRMMGAYPSITLAELSDRTCVDEDYIIELFSLQKLAKEYDLEIKRGRICISNAYSVARLKDHEEQLIFFQRAKTLKPVEFMPLVWARVKEIRDEARAKTKIVKATEEVRKERREEVLRQRRKDHKAATRA